MELRNRSAKSATGLPTPRYAWVCESVAGEYQIDRQVWGDRPLSVVRLDGSRNYEVVYDKAVRKRYGMEEEREGEALS
jgi:hypothetical protein